MWHTFMVDGNGDSSGSSPNIGIVDGGRSFHP
jgi:hypothetical protein